jgi:hypothetical protein
MEGHLYFLTIASIQYFDDFFFPLFLHHFLRLNEVRVTGAIFHRSSFDYARFTDLCLGFDLEYVKFVTLNHLPIYFPRQF